MFQSPPHDLCDSIIDFDTTWILQRHHLCCWIRLSFHPSFSNTCKSHPRTFRLSPIQPRMTEAAKLKGEPMSLFRPRCVLQQKLLDFECQNLGSFFVVDLRGLNAPRVKEVRGPLGFVAWTTCHDMFHEIRWTMPRCEFKTWSFLKPKKAPGNERSFPQYQIHQMDPPVEGVASYGHSYWKVCWRCCHEPGQDISNAVKWAESFGAKFDNINSMNCAKQH